MNPTQPAQDHDAIIKFNKKNLIWGLIWLIGPTALLIISILLYAVFNYIFGISNYDGIGTRIISVILYLVGAFTVATWLPGIIVGIVLLAKRKPLQQPPSSLL